MRQWINLCEMQNPITVDYIRAAYDAMDGVIPEQILVDLDDQSIHGFADLGNMVEIKYIEVPEGDLRGKGYASKALKILTALADKRDVTLVVTVALDEDDSDWPMSFEELSAWYERHGFWGDRKMIRMPKTAAVDDQ
jgi:hypothetical protein